MELSLRGIPIWERTSPPARELPFFRMAATSRLSESTVSAAVGPTLTAGILATATWPYLFAINIPFGIGAVVIGMRALPHTPRNRHVFDWQSAPMSAIMFGLGIAAIDSVGHGEEPLLYLSEAVITTIASMMLVRRQLTAASSCTTVYREKLSAREEHTISQNSKQGCDQSATFGHR